MPVRTVLLLLCFCIAAAPTMASAQASLDAEQETRLVALIEEGKAAYDAGEFAEARRKFGEAHDLYPHPDLLYRIALCHERLGEDVRAVSFYREFLAASPDAPERARIEKTIEVIESRIARSEIRVDTEPDGAAVYINDEANGAAGYSPTALTVKPGNYKLIVRKEGFEPVRELVIVDAGQSVQVRYQLEETPADATLREPETWVAKGPSVKVVTLLVVGGASGLSSVLFFNIYADKKAQMASKPRNEFSRTEFAALQRDARLNLVLGITTGTVAAASLVWAYGAWINERSATASLLPTIGWADGPTATWSVRF